MNEKNSKYCKRIHKNVKDFKDFTKLLKFSKYFTISKEFTRISKDFKDVNNAGSKRER